MDNPKAAMPKQRTGLVTTELASYHLDITALSETRRANEGQLTEDGGRYCFFSVERSHESRFAKQMRVLPSRPT